VHLDTTTISKEPKGSPQSEHQPLTPSLSPSEGEREDLLLRRLAINMTLLWSLLRERMAAVSRCAEHPYRMKTLPLIALIFAAFAPHAQAAAPNDDASKQDLHAMQGTWTVVSSEQNGEKRTDLDAVRKMRLTIKNDQWTLEYHNNVNDQHAATIERLAQRRNLARHL